MDGVTLVSGGLDSSVMALLIKEQGLKQAPLFIDYGQLAVDMEWKYLKTLFKKFELPNPKRINLSGYGNTIQSGITDDSLDINKNAFLPGRNLMFIVVGGSLCYQLKGDFVSIGLLDEEFATFPDQSELFISLAEDVLETALGERIKILTPLSDFSKAEVIQLAKDMDIKLNEVYSCHKGNSEPCSKCISCKERIEAKKQIANL